VVDGIFSSRSASTLSPEIATQISFFLTVGPRAELGQETGETISGSLVVAPAAKKIETVATAAGSAEEPKPAAFVGPKLILVRSGSVATLQLREAPKVEAKADVLEVLGHDGSLQTVSGKSSVLAVLPAPVAEASREKAKKAVELYEEVMERHPEAETLLADAHRRWKELAETAVVASNW
jgi:ABC-type amino acid transport substrate-binding protein